MFSLLCQWKLSSQSGWLFRWDRSVFPSVVLRPPHFHRRPVACSKGPARLGLINSCFFFVSSSLCVSPNFCIQGHIHAGLDKVTGSCLRSQATADMTRQETQTHNKPIGSERDTNPLKGPRLSKINWRRFVDFLVFDRNNSGSLFA